MTQLWRSYAVAMVQQWRSYDVDILKIQVSVLLLYKLPLLRWSLKQLPGEQMRTIHLGASPLRYNVPACVFGENSPFRSVPSMTFVALANIKVFSKTIWCTKQLCCWRTMKVSFLKTSCCVFKACIVTLNGFKFLLKYFRVGLHFK